jgi:hypothetical protein
MKATAFPTAMQSCALSGFPLPNRTLSSGCGEPQIEASFKMCQLVLVLDHTTHSPCRGVVVTMVISAWLNKQYDVSHYWNVWNSLASATAKETAHMTSSYQLSRVHLLHSPGYFIAQRTASCSRGTNDVVRITRKKKSKMSICQWINVCIIWVLT